MSTPTPTKRQIDLRGRIDIPQNFWDIIKAKVNDTVYVIGRADYIEIRKVLPAPNPVPDTTAPVAPTGLTVSSSSTTNEVNLNWSKNPEPDINRYDIIRDGINIGSTAATSGTTFKDTTVKPDSTYSYAVQAIDNTGNRGSMSTAVSIKTSPAPSPTPTPIANLYDDFNWPNQPYSFTPGGTSPNGKWICDFFGKGFAKVENGGLVISPASTTLDIYGGSAQVRSTQKWRDGRVEFDVTTELQTVTQNTAGWMSAWFLFRHLDKWRHFYVGIGLEHLEFGVKDAPTNLTNQADIEKYQYTLWTGAPATPVKTKRHIAIEFIGNHFKFWCDGVLVHEMDYVSTFNDQAGSITPYTEGSQSRYDNITMTSTVSPTPTPTPSPTPTPTNIYDNFDSPTSFDFKQNGTKSPNGKWLLEYGIHTVGYDADGYAKIANGQITIRPKQENNVTHSILIRSTQKWANAKFSFDATLGQRNWTTPESWHSFWFFFRHQNSFRHMYGVLKTTGFEFGKKDVPDGTPQDIVELNQRFTYQNTNFKVVPGKKHHIDVEVTGGMTPTVKIWLDNVFVGQYTDNGTLSDKKGLIPKPTYGDGEFCLYSEDAETFFDNIVITQLP